MTPAEEIRDFWFRDLDASGVPTQADVARWFRGGAVLDDEIRERFGAHVERALQGRLEAWRTEPTGTLALVLLLDQFTRNVYRGDARAFSGDGLAREIARERVESGSHLSFLPVERYFLYMPFMHAENLEDQDLGVRLFSALEASVLESGASKSAAEFFAVGTEWARRHRDAIKSVGRFPARNDALGRESRPDERAFLLRHPEGF
jgi:uncharacterized protein (DUF924 family)